MQGAHFSRIAIGVEGFFAPVLHLISGVSNLVIEAHFKCIEPINPTLGLVIVGHNGRPVTSVSSLLDGTELRMDHEKEGSIRLVFPKFPLLRGQYWVNLYLLCEKGLYTYDRAECAAQLLVEQKGPELGVVQLPHCWESLRSSD